ncbi:esterase [Streptomyces noursei ATCC 11455]|uniref:alpha/beta hydrolase n=1 Tax=Streptomyces noursei TaxID=1971 RepID=UPI00081C3585|nr:esterase [Streptomyces noursei ATCC 11455]
MTSATSALSFAQRLRRAVGILPGRIPPAVLRRLVRVPVNADGEQMAPEIALLMSAAAKADDYSALAPRHAREVTDAEAVLFGDRIPPLPVEEDLEVPGGLRATRHSAGGSPSGLILFFHGGGFVLGSRAGYAPVARLLARRTGADVLSVDYRLAPEHPFPAAHEDAMAAWEFAVDQAPRWGVDSRRIVVAGDSAGGNLAAVLCQQLRGRAMRPSLQVLIYPAVDLSVKRPSYKEFADSPALTAKQIRWFTDHYLPPGTDVTDPRVSPLLGDLAGLPPAVVSVAGFDPLRDEGLEYTTRLLGNGVPTQVLREGGLVHGFIGFTALSRTSRAATERIAAAIARSLPSPGSARSRASGTRTPRGVPAGRRGR